MAKLIDKKAARGSHARAIKPGPADDLDILNPDRTITIQGERITVSEYGFIVGLRMESVLATFIGIYVPLPVSLNDAAPNIYGTLDGIYCISGFDNATENTTVIDGDTYVVLQDGTRNGFNDYMLLRLA